MILVVFFKEVIHFVKKTVPLLHVVTLLPHFRVFAVGLFKRIDKIIKIYDCTKQGFLIVLHSTP